MFNKFITIFISIVIILLPGTVFAEASFEMVGSNTIERLSNAVKDQKISLDDYNKTKIIAGCVDSQNYIQTVKQQSDSAIIKRLNVYSGIQKDMQTIKLRMMHQGADASETDLLTGKLQQLLDQLTLQADIYGMTLNDIITVDCQTNPEAFKAGIVLARAQRAKVLSISSRLKSTFDNADKNIYEQLKRRLEI